MNEPFICPECGHEGTKSADSEVCVFCEWQYQQGREDVELERFERACFGDEYADREAFLRDFNEDY